MIMYVFQVMCNQRSKEFKYGSTVESSEVLIVSSVVRHSAFGYAVSDNVEGEDLWLINK